LLKKVIDSSVKKKLLSASPYPTQNNKTKNVPLIILKLPSARSVPLFNADFVRRFADTLIFHILKTHFFGH